MPPRGLIRGRLPAHARLGDLLIKLGDELIEIGRVLPWMRRIGRGAAAPRRFSIQNFWSSVAGSDSMSGSSSRCQPSRHCAARRVRARSAQRTPYILSATPIYLEHGESVLPLS